MKMAIIGAGNVGGSMGKRWAQAGHEIVFGVPNPTSEKTNSLLASISKNARATRVSEAAAVSDVIVLTVPWEAVQAVANEVGDCKGKPLIDVTNPIIMSQEGLTAGLVVGHTTSAAEQLAQWAPSARVVKAFNQTGAGNMADSHYGGERPTIFYCGDDVAAKNIAAGLGEELGFEMIDAGPLRAARLLEPLAMLWIHLAIAQGMGTNFAFKVLRR